MPGPSCREKRWTLNTTPVREAATGAGPVTDDAGLRPRAGGRALPVSTERGVLDGMRTHDLSFITIITYE